MAWAASLSANAPTESSGYRVPAKPDLSRVPEPRGSQSVDESWPTDRWLAIWRSTSGRPANRRTADRRTTARWSADWGTNY